jgi:Uma2 family endonuclease
MNPPGNLHGSVEAQFTGRLLYEGELKRHGKVRCGEVGIVLRREPQARVVGADVVFIASRSLPIKESPEGYLETIPDLVVEVRSKNYADNFVAQRVADYLAAGVAVVWVVDPRTKSVSVHLPHAEPRLFQGDDVLEAEDIVPGMRIRVRDVFEE